ncbi:MAG TPA: ribonuclease P protein component [Longimicrobiales bacterium]
MNTQRPDAAGSDVPGKRPAARDRLPRTRRITSSREIRALFQRGKRSRTAHLDVFDFASPLAYPRVGVVVPKHRRSAVERNRLKRRLREVLRQDVLPRLRQNGVESDVLIRARREAYLATFSQLRDELVAWVERKWSHAS